MNSYTSREINAIYRFLDASAKYAMTQSMTFKLIEEKADELKQVLIDDLKVDVFTASALRSYVEQSMLDIYNHQLDEELENADY